MATEGTDKMSHVMQKRGGSTNAFQTSSFADLASVSSNPELQTGRSAAAVHLSAGSSFLDGPNGAIVMLADRNTQGLTVRGGGKILLTAALEFLNRMPRVTTTGDLVVQSVGTKQSRLSEALTLFESDRSIAWRKAGGARLRALLVDFRQDHDGADYSFESLLAFHEFCQISPSLKAPFLTVTEGGEIYARWKCSQDEVLSLRFFDCAQVSFVVFRLNAATVERRSGRVPTGKLAAAIDLPALSWVRM
jgi:hypothetical protein